MTLCYSLHLPSFPLQAAFPRDALASLPGDLSQRLFDVLVHVQALTPRHLLQLEGAEIEVGRGEGGREGGRDEREGFKKGRRWRGGF